MIFVWYILTSMQRERVHLSVPPQPLASVLVAAGENSYVYRFPTLILWLVRIGFVLKGLGTIGETGEFHQQKVICACIGMGIWG
jgi:hypothetical protein